MNTELGVAKEGTKSMAIHEVDVLMKEGQEWKVLEIELKTWKLKN